MLQANSILITEDHLFEKRNIKSFDFMIGNKGLQFYKDKVVSIRASQHKKSSSNSSEYERIYPEIIDNLNNWIYIPNSMHTLRNALDHKYWGKSKKPIIGWIKKMTKELDNTTMDYYKFRPFRKPSELMKLIKNYRKNLEQT